MAETTSTDGRTAIEEARPHFLPQNPASLAAPRAPAPAHVHAPTARPLIHARTGVLASVSWLALGTAYIAGAALLSNSNIFTPTTVGALAAGLSGPLAVIWLMVLYGQRLNDVDAITAPVRRQLNALLAPGGTGEARVKRITKALQEQAEMLRHSASVALDDSSAAMAALGKQGLELKRLSGENISELSHIAKTAETTLQTLQASLGRIHAETGSERERALAMVGDLEKHIHDCLGQVEKLATGHETRLTGLTRVSEQIEARSKNIMALSGAVDEKVQGTAGGAMRDLERLESVVAELGQRSAAIAHQLGRPIESLERAATHLDTNMRQSQEMLEGATRNLEKIGDNALSRASSLVDSLTDRVGSMELVGAKLVSIGSAAQADTGRYVAQVEDIASRIKAQGEQGQEFIRQALQDFESQSTHVLERSGQIAADLRGGTETLSDALRTADERFDAMATDIETRAGRLNEIGRSSGQQLQTIRLVLDEAQDSFTGQVEKLNQMTQRLTEETRRADSGATALTQAGAGAHTQAEQLVAASERTRQTLTSIEGLIAEQQIGVQQMAATFTAQISALTAAVGAQQNVLKQATTEATVSGEEVRASLRAQVQSISDATLETALHLDTLHNRLMNEGETLRSMAGTLEDRLTSLVTDVKSQSDTFLEAEKSLGQEQRTLAGIAEMAGGRMAELNIRLTESQQSATSAMDSVADRLGILRAEIDQAESALLETGVTIEGQGEKARLDAGKVGEGLAEVQTRLQNLIAGMQSAGTALEQQSLAAGGLIEQAGQQLANSTSQLARESAAARRELVDVGLVVDERHNALRDMHGTIERMSDSLMSRSHDLRDELKQNLQQGTEQAAAAMQQAENLFSSLLERLTSATGAVGRETENAGELLEGTLQTLRETSDVFSGRMESAEARIAAVQGELGALSQRINTEAQLMQGGVNAFSRQIEEVEVRTGQASATLTGLSSQLTEQDAALGRRIEKLKADVEGLSETGHASAQTLAAMSDTVKANVSSLSEAVKADVESVANAVMSNVAGLGSAVRTDISGISDSVKSDIVGMGAAVTDHVASIGGAIRADVSGISEALRSDIENVSFMLKANSVDLGSAVRADVLSLREAVTDDIETMSTAARTNVAQLSDTVRANVTGLTETMKADVASLGATVQDNLNGLGEAVRENMAQLDASASLSTDRQQALVAAIGETQAQLTQLTWQMAELRQTVAETTQRTAELARSGENVEGRLAETLSLFDVRRSALTETTDAALVRVAMLGEEFTRTLQAQGEAQHRLEAHAETAEQLTSALQQAGTAADSSVASLQNRMQDLSQQGQQDGRLIAALVEELDSHERRMRESGEGAVQILRQLQGHISKAGQMGFAMFEQTEGRLTDATSQMAGRLSDISRYGDGLVVRLLEAVRDFKGATATLGESGANLAEDLTQAGATLLDHASELTRRGGDLRGEMTSHVEQAAQSRTTLLETFSMVREQLTDVDARTNGYLTTLQSRTVDVIERLQEGVNQLAAMPESIESTNSVLLAQVESARTELARLRHDLLEAGSNVQEQSSATTQSAATLLDNMRGIAAESVTTLSALDTAGQNLQDTAITSADRMSAVAASLDGAEGRTREVANVAEARINGLVERLDLVTLQIEQTLGGISVRYQQVTEENTSGMRLLLTQLDTGADRLQGTTATVRDDFGAAIATLNNHEQALAQLGGALGLRLTDVKGEVENLLQSFTGMDTRIGQISPTMSAQQAKLDTFLDALNRTLDQVTALQGQTRGIASENLDLAEKLIAGEDRLISTASTLEAKVGQLDNALSGPVLVRLQQAMESAQNMEGQLGRLTNQAGRLDGSLQQIRVSLEGDVKSMQQAESGISSIAEKMTLKLLETGTALNATLSQLQRGGQLSQSGLLQANEETQRLVVRLEQVRALVKSMMGAMATDISEWQYDLKRRMTTMATEISEQLAKMPTPKAIEARPRVAVPAHSAPVPVSPAMAIEGLHALSVDLYRIVQSEVKELQNELMPVPARSQPMTVEESKSYTRLMADQSDEIFNRQVCDLSLRHAEFRQYVERYLTRYGQLSEIVKETADASRLAESDLGRLYQKLKITASTKTPAESAS